MDDIVALVDGVLVGVGVVVGECVIVEVKLTDGVTEEELEGGGKTKLGDRTGDGITGVISGLITGVI